jgi:hypothetical protein
MDATKGALRASPRVLRRDAEVNRTADLTLAIAYRRLLDQPTDLQNALSSVQPQLACADLSADGKESGYE